LVQWELRRLRSRRERLLAFERQLFERSSSSSRFASSRDSQRRLQMELNLSAAFFKILRELQARQKAIQ
jgi:hypothetical protein